MKTIPSHFNFTEEEFACKCCGLMNIDKDFLNKLQLARIYAGVPFKITSGCRCYAHNKEAGGRIGSAHISSKTHPSKAADIHFQDNRQRYHIIYGLMRAGFSRLGMNEKDQFIHVDNKTGEWLWSY